MLLFFYFGCNILNTRQTDVYLYLCIIYYVQVYTLVDTAGLLYGMSMIVIYVLYVCVCVYKKTVPLLIHNTLLKLKPTIIITLYILYTIAFYLNAQQNKYTTQIVNNIIYWYIGRYVFEISKQFSIVLRNKAYIGTIPKHYTQSLSEMHVFFSVKNKILKNSRVICW